MCRTGDDAAALHHGLHRGHAREPLADHRLRHLRLPGQRQAQALRASRVAELHDALGGRRPGGRRAPAADPAAARLAELQRHAPRLPRPVRVAVRGVCQRGDRRGPGRAWLRRVGRLAHRRHRGEQPRAAAPAQAVPQRALAAVAPQPAPLLRRRRLLVARQAGVHGALLRRHPHLRAPRHRRHRRHRFGPLPLRLLGPPRLLRRPEGRRDAQPAARVLSPLRLARQRHVHQARGRAGSLGPRRNRAEPRDGGGGAGEGGGGGSLRGRGDPAGDWQAKGRGSRGQLLHAGRQARVRDAVLLEGRGRHRRRVRGERHGLRPRVPPLLPHHASGLLGPRV
mmetsp:Transcript_45088/g.145337  ORF Transcript_45088/g.145337 Transcript_45088/m.145337 type:complete len:338 (+) Transcript_45088:749-1762(+)